MSHARAEFVEAHAIRWLRTKHRTEVGTQIVHDSLHARSGWTVTYQLVLDSHVVGFASTAVAGPWNDRPTIFEFYLLPEVRDQTFRLFETFLETSQAKLFEVQSNESLLTAMFFRYATNIQSESMVFYDHARTSLDILGARVQCETPESEVRAAIEKRSGGGEWVLIVEGSNVAKGGVLFHYNQPYGDIYMEVVEPHRRRGYGAFFVQAMKRACYELGVIPCARCNPTNVASQRTLQKAGFVPYAHILNGELRP